VGAVLPNITENQTNASENDSNRTITAIPTTVSTVTRFSICNQART